MSGDSVYKRCKCRGPDGKEAGPDCPKLRRGDGSWNPRHGTWYFALELPPGPGGKRRPRMRRGGFATREDAEAAQKAARRVIEKGADPSVRVSTEAYLRRWLAGLADLKPTTVRNYRITVDTYLIPLLGHIPLRQLTRDHVAGAFDAIRQWNQALASGKPVRSYQRDVGPAAMQRIRDVLRGALNDAVRAGAADFNAAVHVRMEPLRSRKPVMWTAERTRKFWLDYEAALEAAPGGRGDRAFRTWQLTRLRPSPVMVWNQADLGAFLDYATRSRLSPLFELAAGTGMRRGELCGLRWTGVDLDAGVIHVITARVQAGWAVVEGGPKSEAGWRHVPLVAGDVATLRAWKAAQAAERLRWGSDWKDTGLVFTKEDGSAWHPQDVSREFGMLAFGARLPPVRLHDIRHAHISYLLALGTDARVVSERAGHSGSQMTRDYAAVSLEVSREAAERASATIPRRARR